MANVNYDCLILRQFITLSMIFFQFLMLIKLYLTIISIINPQFCITRLYPSFDFTVNQIYAIPHILATLIIAIIIFIYFVV